MTKNKDNSSLPKTALVTGSLHAQMIRCGRDNCCCAHDERHGPYFYLYHREHGQLRKRYVRLSDVEAVQAQCDAQSLYKAQDRQARQRRKVTEHEAREEYRRLIGKLKQVTGGGES